MSWIQIHNELVTDSSFGCTVLCTVSDCMLIVTVMPFQCNCTLFHNEFTKCSFHCVYCSLFYGAQLLNALSMWLYFVWWPFHNVQLLKVLSVLLYTHIHNVVTECAFSITVHSYSQCSYWKRFQYNWTLILLYTHSQYTVTECIFSITVHSFTMDSYWMHFQYYFTLIHNVQLLN